MDVEVAAQLPESFSHAPDSDSGRARRGHLKLFFRRYTLASILHFNAKVAVRGGNANPGCRAFRMAMNVGETFLYGSEDCGFCLAREPLKIRGDLQIHFNLAPFGESVDVPMESRSQSRFIQQRGMEQVGNRADLPTEFLYQSRTVVNRTGGLHEAFDVGSNRGKVHSQRSQHLPYAVVQLTGNAPSLINLQLHQTRRELAQILIRLVEFYGAFLYCFS